MSWQFQFKKPSKTPPKDFPFNLDIFTKSTSDNVLKKALKAMFMKAGTVNAAWDYFTLEKSCEILRSLTGDISKV